MKNLLLVILLSTLPIAMQAQDLSPEKVVQIQLDTYNQRDLTGFMAVFHDSAQIINHADGKILASGKVEVEKLYANLFEQSPKLHSTLLNRMVLGTTVIDHESITGRMGLTQPIELIVIYEVSDSKIIKATVIRP